MRIIPVTGDLPAVVTPPPPPVRPVAEPAPVAAQVAPVAHAGAAGPDTDAAADRRRPHSRPWFDPPLIAQRAVLGLPTGYLIAQLAESEGTTCSAVEAAVDRHLPRGD